jgi:hypothetical protein
MFLRNVCSNQSTRRHIPEGDILHVCCRISFNLLGLLTGIYECGPYLLSVVILPSAADSTEPPQLLHTQLHCPI